MKNYIILIFLCLFSSCQKPQIAKVQIIDAPVAVEIVPKADTLILADLFGMFEHIELKGILLGDISDVKLVNNLILVQSKVQGKDIHIFDRGGNYIRSIIRYGRANNEVLNLQSFCYNKYKNTIDVLCNYGTEIKQYTIDKNLSPITISLPKESIIAAKDIEIVDDSTYVLYKDISYLDSLEFKLYLFNYQEKSIIGKFIPLNKEIEEKISFSQNNNLYTHDGKIFFL